MRTLCGILFGLSVLLNAGCGGEEKPAQKAKAPAPAAAAKKPADSGKTAETTVAQAPVDDAAQMPCSLFKVEELQQVLGTPVQAGRHKSENITESGYDWKAESCFWAQKSDAETGLTVKVSLGKHFFGKEVECYELTGDPKELKVNASPAWWKFFNSVGRGTLRACDTATALVHVQLDQEGGEESALESKAVDIVKKTLERVKKG